MQKSLPGSAVLSLLYKILNSSKEPKGKICGLPRNGLFVLWLIQSVAVKTWDGLNNLCVKSWKLKTLFCRNKTFIHSKSLKRFQSPRLVDINLFIPLTLDFSQRSYSYSLCLISFPAKSSRLRLWFPLKSLVSIDDLRDSFSHSMSCFLSKTLETTSLVSVKYQYRLRLWFQSKTSNTTMFMVSVN